MTTYQSLLLDFTPRPISTEREYQRVLKYIAEHVQPHPPRAEAELLELLSTLVVQYESQKYPSPEVSAGDMLAHLIDARGVSRAEVASESGIPRSTITNVINGRRGLSKANAKVLAQYFGVHPATFLVAAETPFGPPRAARAN
jgi:HTH-type transcriptional regulator/antitoxin HigA